LRKSAVAIITAIPVTLLLSSVGVFRQLEMPALDATMHLAAMQLYLTPRDSDVVIVRITQDDYKNIFKGRSPLDPGELQTIINAIAAGRPKVIGVDVDTAPPQFQQMELPTGGPPIVWAREATYSNKEDKYYLDDVLGGKVPPPSASGLVMLKLDEDKVVRRYQRLYDTDTGSFPSFAWAVLKEYRGGLGKPLEDSKDEMLIQFAGNPGRPYRFDLPTSEIKRLALNEHWAANGILRDKIVLLGGSYAGRDEHNTPLGWMVGVEVMAHVLDTELKGGGVRPPNTILIILLGVIAGVLLWMLLNHYPLRYSFPLSLLVIPALAFLCSLMAFRSVSEWAYFIPILLAVLGQQLYERFKDSQKKVPAK
jgi:CHASE2 domain-containing sensor protein